MRDILERHAPEYWNGRSETTQTFFPEGTTFEQLQDAVRDVLSQNREKIIADPSEYQWLLEGTSNGVHYDVGIYRGRITHLVPK